MSPLTTLGLSGPVSLIASGQKIITEGLILHLDAGNSSSYSGSGTAWNNLISGQPSAYNATLNNGPTFDSNNGGSIYFDGVNDNVSTLSQLDPGDGLGADGLYADSSSSWSVSSWFKPDITRTSNSAVTGKGGGTGGSATYVVWFNGTQLRTRLRGGTILNITTSLSSTWNEVVITWDGTTAKAYLNGSFVSNIAVGNVSKQTNNFTVGSTAGGNSIRYRGNISEVKVYSRAISDVEVLKNYNVLSSRYL